jgi:hypothetical protein
LNANPPVCVAGLLKRVADAFYCYRTILQNRTSQEIAIYVPSSAKNPIFIERLKAIQLATDPNAHIQAQHAP